MSHKPGNQEESARPADGANHFSAGRYFYAGGGWYMYMRSGDEKHNTCWGMKKVAFTLHRGRVIAGPFRTKRAMLNWFDSFVTLLAARREREDSFISDEIVLPDGGKSVTL